MSPSLFATQTAAEFACKNPQRSALCSIYFDINGMAITTDGHRLFATKELFEIQRSGQLFRAQDYFEKNEYVPLSEKFPEWTHVVPSGHYDTPFNLQVPSWFKSLSGSAEQVLMTLDYSDRKRPKIVCGSFLHESAIGFDARYLSTFAGKELQILVNNDTSVFAITAPGVSLEGSPEQLKASLLKLDWFALIMPVRLDPIEKAPRSGPNIFV